MALKASEINEVIDHASDIAFLHDQQITLTFGVGDDAVTISVTNDDAESDDAESDDAESDDEGEDATPRSDAEVYVEGAVKIVFIVCAFVGLLFYLDYLPIK